MPRRRIVSDSEADSAVATAVAEPPPAAEPAPAPPAPAPPSPPKRLVVSDYQAVSIWQAMERMTQDDWSDKMLYVYRSHPFTVNKNTGLKYGSIFKGGHPGITEEQIQDNFGGGKFRLWLKLGKVTLCDAYAGPYTGKPKLLPDEQLMLTQDDAAEEPAAAGDSSNALLLQIVERLLTSRENAEATGDSKKVDSITRGLDIVTEAAKKANALVADANKPQSTDQIVQTFTAVKALLEPKDKEDSLTRLLITKLLDRAFAPAAAPATAANPVMDKLQASLLERFLEDLESPHRGGSDWKSMLIQAIPSVVQHLAQMAKTIQSRPIVVNMPRNFQPGPVAPRPTIPMEAPMIQADAPAPFNPADLGNGAPQPLDESGSPSPVIPAQAGIQPSTYELAPLDQIKRRLVAMFYRGKPGDLCASFIEDAAPALYEHLKGQSAETLLTVMQMDPILREISGQPGIKEWIEELVVWIKETEEEAPSTPEPQAAPVN